MKVKVKNLLNIIIGILVIVLLIVIIHNNTNLKKNVNNLINKNNSSNSGSNGLENDILELKQSLDNLSNQYNEDMKLLKDRTCYIKNFSDWRYAGGDRDIISIYKNKVCDF